jgi:hypothetical protein
VTKTVVPFPIFDSISASAFILEANCFTSDSPNPVPFVLARAFGVR